MKNNVIYQKVTMFALIAALSGGCAISNEGSTDYRYIKRSNHPELANCQGNCTSIDQTVSKVKYIKPRETAQHAIKPKDPLVVSLKQIFIKDFIETNTPLRVVRGEKANGEIAIVVNAFEVGKGESINFGPDGKKNARVVFYTDDVWKGQFLNLSNLSTIYGPLTYDGGPFVLDLYVIEMDTPGPQLRQLLSNLAAIGSTFYPPASPIAGPLAQLAGTLIKDDQDDRAYHYTAEFKPIAGGDPDLNSGFLLTGDYVFIREGDRNVTTNWSELDYDEKTGRLVFNGNRMGKSHCMKAPDQDYPADCYYRENSYVVVEINTAESALQNDRTQMIFQALSDSVHSQSAPILTSPVPGEVLSGLSSGINKIQVRDGFTKQLKVLNNSNDAVKRTIALNRFLKQWTNSAVVISEQDKEHFEDLLALKLTKCTNNDHNKVINMMTKLQDRANFSIENNPDILQALSCT